MPKSHYKPNMPLPGAKFALEYPPKNSKTGNTFHARGPENDLSSRRVLVHGTTHVNKTERTAFIF